MTYGNRLPSGETRSFLADGDEVRVDAVLANEAAISQPKADYLVDDEHDAEACRQLACQRHELALHGDQPGTVRQQINEDRGKAIRLRLDDLPQS